ncbi:hypothetical protein M758_12G052800 [Ceratodon purpureus]|nr:hypothetical protein M758_12G052800 [Ceratodon purpureus]
MLPITNATKGTQTATNPALTWAMLHHIVCCNYHHVGHQQCNKRRKNYDKPRCNMSYGLPYWEILP